MYLHLGRQVLLGDLGDRGVFNIEDTDEDRKSVV